MHKIAPASVCLAVLLLSVGARAQAPGAAAADALFEQGRAALTAGDLDKACARFRESDRLDPQPGTKANLGDCEEKRGHVASAWEAFRASLEKLPRTDTRVSFVKQHIASLTPRLPRLSLSLAPDAPKDTTVREGDATIGTAGTFGVALPFDPGVHHFTIVAPGRAAKSLDVILVEGKTTTLVVEPGSSDGGAPPGPTRGDTPAAPTEGGASPGPWIVGGIGIAGLIVGGVTGALVLQKKSVTDANCTNGNPPTCKNQDGIDAANAGRTLGPISTIGFIVGGAGVAAGAIWLGVRSSGKPKAAFSVTPVVGGVAWQVEGSW